MGICEVGGSKRVNDLFDRGSVEGDSPVVCVAHSHECEYVVAAAFRLNRQLAS